MPHYLEDVNFAGHALHIRLIFDLVLLKDLDRNLLPCEDVRSKPYFPESPLAKRPPFTELCDYCTYQRYSVRFAYCLIEADCSFVAPVGQVSVLAAAD